MGDTMSIDTARLPLHVGIIMDGNGRWAKKRRRPRSFGHREGVKAAKRVVASASEMGIRYLTLFVFSTENWRRAQDEVFFLMYLIRQHLKKELSFYQQKRIRIIHSGDPEHLPDDVVGIIDDVVRATADHEGMTLNLAINYGGKDEIVRAVRRWLRHTQDNGRDLASFSEKELAGFLDHPEVPDVDFIIRTSGERRISNFMLWEGAYAELYFSPTLWPDWDGESLEEAIREYQRRDRTFGCSREG